MNKEQLKIIAAHRCLSSESAKLAELVLIDGLTGYAAEKKLYGKKKDKAGYVCKRIQKEYDYYQALRQAE